MKVEYGRGAQPEKLANLPRREERLSSVRAGFRVAGHVGKW